jgi:hypothetical protein
VSLFTDCFSMTITSRSTIDILMQICYYKCVINVFAEEVPVRSGALFRNGNAERPARSTANNGKYLREKGKYRFQIISRRRQPGFFVFISPGYGLREVGYAGKFAYLVPRISK